MVFSSVPLFQVSSRVDRIADSTTTSLDSPSPLATHVNSLSSTTADPSAKGGLRLNVVDGTGLTSSLGSTQSPQTAHTENQTPPIIPVRTSSNSHLPSSNVSPLSGSTAIDASNFQRDSKASGKAGSRTGSVASSRRLQKARAPSNANTHVQGAEGLQTAPAAEKPKKRGVAKFLSILHCCSSHENANKAESNEKIVPADQAKVLRQIRENQTAAVVTPNASAGNSSAEETKEVDGGNIGGPPYSEHTPAAQPKTMSPPAPNTPSAAKVELLNDAGSNLDEKQDFGNTATRDEPPPSLPASNAPTARDDPAARLHASNPIVANDGEGVVSSQAYSPDHTAAPATAGKDSALQRETGDGDVIMAEAVPMAPVPSEQSKSQEARTESQLPISLPPPPPRATQSQTAVGVGRSQSNATAPNERPPWLLPPLQPRFQGKKCLVLDLDETLVHSSFKVSFNKCPGIFQALMSTDAAPGGFHHPGRNRGSVSQRVRDQAAGCGPVYETRRRAL